MECIFIGDDFYNKSGSMMSPIYQIVREGYIRTDWGKVNCYLRDGESVHIRPATKEEMDIFMKKLGELIVVTGIDYEDRCCYCKTTGCTKRMENRKEYCTERT